MAQPTLALTFQDLILRVAEFLGIADYSGGTAAIPSDAHDLEVCKRLVNDGYRKFITANPDGWNFLTPIFTLTFVSGQAAYDLPAGFYGDLLYPFTYDVDGPATAIRNVDESTIRQLNQSGLQQGDPTVVALRPKSVTVSTTGARWEAVFYPTPNNVYTVTARARIFPDKLVNLADQHVAGFQHDESVLTAALSEAEQQRDDAAGNQTGRYRDAVARSMMVDRKAQAKRIGDYGDKSEDRGEFTRRYTGVDTINGVPIP